MALSVAIALVGAGCAKKKTETPIDVKKQAFIDLRQEIQTVISDPERAGKAIEIAGEIEDTFDTITEHRVEANAKIRALNADYDAPKEEFVALFSEIQKEMKSNKQRISELHRQMVDVTTAEELAKLAKSRSAAMTSVIESMQ